MDLSSLSGPDGWVDLLRAVGFGDADLAAGDSRQLWIVTCERTGAQIASLTDEQIGRLRALWPNGTHIEVLLGNQPQAQITDPDLRQKLSQLDPVRTFRVQLTLEKERILAPLGTNTDAVRWFVAPNACRSLSDATHRLVESEWFGKGDTAIVVVPDENVRLVGAFLKVVGSGALKDVVVPQPTNADRLALATQVAWRAEALWDDDFALVTPTQFDVAGVGWDEPAGALVARAAAHLTMLYTADRVRAGAHPGAIRSEYHGRSGTVTIGLGTNLPDAPGPTARACNELTRWVFGGDTAERNWHSDRLDIVRLVTFERLRHVAEPARARRFFEEVSMLTDDSKWHWRLFMSGKLDDHADAVDTFRDAVSSAVDTYAKATSDIVASIIDGMKAAVATVLGSFIGAALSDKFNETVFRIGMFTYAVYIVVFPGVFGLGNAIVEHGTTRSTYDAARAHGADVLGEDKVTTIEGTRTGDAERRFWIAFGLAAAVFALVAFAAIVAQAVVPAHLD